MTRDEVFQAISTISARYTVFECVECAAAIKQWLKDNSISGIHLQIVAVGRIKFIVSRRWNNGGNSIAQTGIHQGIETYGKVFDNLGADGLDRDQWVADFDCASGEFEVIELELF
ncbi:MAG: papain fold toxin domain-containing protein [Cyanobacteria bacterium P01_H01_bin.26]